MEITRQQESGQGIDLNWSHHLLMDSQTLNTDLGEIPRQDDGDVEAEDEGEGYGGELVVAVGH